ncbi:MAG: hypothetical protein ACE5LU_06660 [Anaerolineae bacterium]
MIRATLMGRLGHWSLTLTALVCASVSILALLLHAAGWLPMYFLVDLLAAPSLVLLLILGVLAYRIDERVFLNRLVTGAWGGLAATLAYDLIRYVLWKGGVFSFNPFLSHPIFGMLITGYPVESVTAIVIGWAYHFWNGFGFGTMYTLVAGRARWYYAVVWAMFLEIGWLTALPSTLQFKLNPELIALSLIGHGAYGIALGFIAQRFIRA